MWTRGVPVEDEAKRQLTNAARLPIVFKHIAAMPDVHFGIGATVGSVIPTLKAIIGTMPAPRFLDRLMASKAWEGQLSSEPAGETEGNLFRPIAKHHAPHGRFDNRAQPTVSAWSASLVRAVLRTAAIAVLVLACVLTGMFA